MSFFLLSSEKKRVKCSEQSLQIFLLLQFLLPRYGSYFLRIWYFIDVEPRGKELEYRKSREAVHCTSLLCLPSYKTLESEYLTWCTKLEPILGYFFKTFLSSVFQFRYFIFIQNEYLYVKTIYNTHIIVYKINPN